MFVELLATVAPIFVCVGIGVYWGRSGLPYPDDFITRLVMNIGAPCLVVSVLGKANVSLDLLSAVATAALSIFILSAIILGIILTFLKQKVNHLLPPLLFGNNGNMGLPLALFAFGQDGLALALCYFWVLAMINFTFGVSMLTWGGNPLQSVKNMFKQPLIYCSLVVMYLFATNSTLPPWIQNTVDLLAGMTIPLMLITLGVSLARLNIEEFKTSFILAFLRLAAGFTIGWSIAEYLGLEGVLKGVVILQASMPAAVSNYLLALKYTESPGKVAGTVVISTLVSLISLPYLVSFAMFQAGS